MSQILTALVRVLEGAWEAFFLAAPFVFAGLVLAGLLHVLVSRKTVERWMGRDGMGAVTRAAAFGVPLPVCSCGVVPVSMELERKGASRPANLSFLITTPESSADAILLTWAMLGPVMAVVRPVASFLTALLAGAGALVWPPEPAPAAKGAAKAAEGAGCGDGCGCASSDGGTGAATGGPACGPDCGCGEAGDAGAAASCGTGCDGDCGTVVDDALGAAAFFRSFGLWISRRSGSRDGSGAADDPPPFPRVVRRIGRYAFVDMLDDIAFWLVVGVLAAGVIIALVPADLAGSPLGSGILPMLLLLVAGVPLYMCASASTPIAAALVAKGISPGAALVFLLSGPATNAATLVLLSRHFGRRFVRLYLVSIVVGSLLCGILLDLLLMATGWQVVATLTAVEEGLVAWAHQAIVAVFTGLVVWRLAVGGLRRGLAEGRDALGSVAAGTRAVLSWSGRRG